MTRDIFDLYYVIGFFDSAILGDTARIADFFLDFSHTLSLYR